MTASIIIGIIVTLIVLVIYKEYLNEKRYREERRKSREQQQKRKRPTAKVTKRTSPPSPKEPSVTHPKPDKELQRPLTKPQQKTKAPTKEERHSGTKQSTNKTDTLQKTQRSKPTAPKVSQTTKPDKADKSIPDTPVVTRKPPQTEPKTGIAKKTETKQIPQPNRKPQAKTDEKILKKAPTPTAQKPSSPDLPKEEYPDFNYERLIEMGLSEEEALEFIQELIPQIKEQISLLDEAIKIPDFHKMERLTHSIKGSSTTIGTGGVSDLIVDYNTYLKTEVELPVAEAYQALLKKYFEKLKKQFPAKEE